MVRLVAVGCDIDISEWRCRG